VNKRTEMAYLLRTGQEVEAAAAPYDPGSLDRIWAVAAHQGLVSPTPPLPAHQPARIAVRAVVRWRRFALIVAIIGMLALAGSAVLWQHVNSGRQLINTDIPNGP
jgi:hypothetical protein